MAYKEIRYELVPHTADCKMRIYGKNVSELFIHSMQGMFEMCEPQKTSPEEFASHAITLTSSKVEYLLVDFLSECLSLSDINNEAYDTATIEIITSEHIMATIRGYKIASFQGIEIKAVTYHDLEVHQKDSRWVATIVFDI